VRNKNARTFPLREIATLAAETAFMNTLVAMRKYLEPGENPIS